MEAPAIKLYYRIKPFVPRAAQILLRRGHARLMRSRHSGVWPIDERAGERPSGWEGWPGGKQFALVLTHDIESAAGVDRCGPLAGLEAERGFRSSFNFVVRDYAVPSGLRDRLAGRGFEVGIHGLHHDGGLYVSRKRFLDQAQGINHHLKEWDAVGFRSPSMHRNLDWLHDLDIEYDASTFDTDPFEPQPDGAGTIFPFVVNGRPDRKGYVELPYSLPQDFCLFVLLRERTIDVWKRKLDWIAAKGGMALVITHPDYQCFSGRPALGEYPADFYAEFLDYIKAEYAGRYWHALPRDVARFWRNRHDAAASIPKRCTSPSLAKRG